MIEHECEYLSDCCGTGAIYGTDIELDEGGAVGICGSCHDWVSFSDEGHTPWDDNPTSALKGTVQQ